MPASLSPSGSSIKRMTAWTLAAWKKKTMVPFAHECSVICIGGVHSVAVVCILQGWGTWWQLCVYCRGGALGGSCVYTAGGGALSGNCVYTAGGGALGGSCVYTAGGGALGGSCVYTAGVGHLVAVVCILQGVVHSAVVCILQGVVHSAVVCILQGWGT